MKSARFLTSPSVQVTLPPNWGYFSWTVSQGGMAVEQRTKQVCHGDTFLLCLASRIAHPVHKRHVSFIQMIRSHLNRLIQGSRLSID